ncbi:hypothetical protein K1719_030796 [Acacia pycnantha]|nr:hypothetical protein K1719_030796 [Acacia pycnantha]
MGTKDFEAFNLALLAKLGWRILQEPDQLWVKILKNRYFPNCSFMDETKGRNSSWLWSCILAGRDVLQGNIISSIGYGRSTRVWLDTWLNDLPGMGLSRYVNDSEVYVILNTRCEISGRQDKWIWTGGRKCTHFVKEGYKVAKTKGECMSSGRPEKSNASRPRIWRNLWKLKTLCPYQHLIDCSFSTEKAEAGIAWVMRDQNCWPLDGSSKVV